MDWLLIGATVLFGYFFHPSKIDLVKLQDRETLENDFTTVQKTLAGVSIG